MLLDLPEILMNKDFSIKSKFGLDYQRGTNTT